MTGNKVVATNRKAKHEYFIELRFEAGIMLMGSEIKSIRAGKVNFGDSHVENRGGELWLVGLHIAEYVFATYTGHEPTRDRKLLLHRSEIDKIIKRVSEKGFTAVPLSVYLKEGKAKVELGLAQGKKKFDKREDIKKRDEMRSEAREYRGR